MSGQVWKCGCLVRDPVAETLHWMLQASWVPECKRCGFVQPDARFTHRRWIVPTP